MKLSSSLVAASAASAAAAAAALFNSTSPPWANLSITAAPDARYLHRTATHAPFLWHADTAWELFHRLNRSDIDAYLRDRARHGFTVVQAVALAELNGTTRPNFYGDLPLVDGDPTRPNEAYFAHVDWAVARAAEQYGILVALVPVWGAYLNCGWYDRSWVIFNESSADAFGAWIGARYPGLPKIIGADSNGFWSCNVSGAQAAYEADTSLDPAAITAPVEDSRAVFAKMADGLRRAEAERGFTSFLTWHPTNQIVRGTPEAYGHNYMNGTLGNVSMDAVQSGHSIADGSTLGESFSMLEMWDSRLNYQKISAMRAAFAGPVIDLENHYEGAHVSFNASMPVWNASDVRHGLWNAVLAGAAGFTYGAHAVWQMYAPEDQLARPDELYMEPRLNQPANESWRDALAYDGAAQTRHLSALFDGLDSAAFDALRPDRAFVGTPDGADDVLAFEGNRYVAALVGDVRYWVYTGYGDAFTLDLDALGAYFGRSGAAATASWYDPRTGEYQNATESLVLQGNETFVPPTGGSVDDDWALVLEVEQ